MTHGILKFCDHLIEMKICSDIWTKLFSYVPTRQLFASKSRPSISLYLSMCVMFWVATTYDFSDRKFPLYYINKNASCRLDLDRSSFIYSALQYMFNSNIVNSFHCRCISAKMYYYTLKMIPGIYVSTRRYLMIQLSHLLPVLLELFHYSTCNVLLAPAYVPVMITLVWLIQCWEKGMVTFLVGPS
jgi:hypothetical protein